MALNSKIPSGPVEKKWDKHRFEMKLVNPANKRKYSVIIVGTGLAGAEYFVDSSPLSLFLETGLYVELISKPFFLHPQVSLGVRFNF
jgi:hypothetical protein